MLKNRYPFGFRNLGITVLLFYKVPPKSVWSACPVIARDSSLARNNKMFATSSGIHGCTFRSLCFAIWPIISGSRVAGLVPATIGVTMVPGQTALQRMFVPAKRSAVWRVIPMIAALDDT